MLFRRAIVPAVLAILLVSCATTEPQPDPGPRPEPPKFRRCQTCEGTQCVVVWIGQKDCTAEEDEQGRFCRAQGSCILGTFGEVAVPTSSDDPRPLPPLDDEVRAAQARVNDLLAGTVVDRLASCWGDLDGDGAVTIEHEYVRGAGGQWEPSTLQAVHSTLPGGQLEQAGKCMGRAVEGIVLPYDPGDADAQELLLVWTWAVPLPESYP